MNKSILTLSTVCLLVVASCSKSKNDPEPGKETGCKVKVVEHLFTENNVNKSEKYYYTYNGDGRITRVDFGKEQSSQYETYAYTINKVTWKNSDGDTEVYNLDANGRITTAVQGNDVINFRYNVSGQLIEAGKISDLETYLYKDGSLAEVYYNSAPWMIVSGNGDMLKNDVVYTWVYANQFLDFDEIGLRVAPFLGNKAMMMPAWIGHYYNTAKQSTYDYKYVGDKDNITEVTVINTKSLVKTTETYRFTYECK